jgi:hypothetical protein
MITYLKNSWERFQEKRRLMAHPLTENPQWKFWQPYVEAKATVLLLHSMKVANNEGELITPVSQNTCREGVLTNMRQYLWKQTMETTGSGYKKKHKRRKRIRLFDPRLHEALQGANSIGIHVNGLKPIGGHKEELTPEQIEQYLLVADALVGLPSVLFSHRRVQGDWWRTDLRTCRQGDYVRWWGTDNWFVRHPTLLAIVTGLARQAALLSAHGFADEVLSRVERSSVEEALTTGDWRLAYGLCTELRDFIEVPNGTDGSYNNYPFPYGQWKRFDRLQRAQRRHDYKKIFDSNFYDSWGLNPDAQGGGWSGAFAYWGNPGKENEAYARLMKLGEPRRRAKGGKSQGKA